MYIRRNVIDPKGIVQVYKNYWWWCEDGDPTKALFYKATEKWRSTGAPQCNANEDIARSIGARLNYGENIKLVQIPLAFEPWEDHN